ncbi:MAG: NYN domain-containing protein [Spirochaetia bacterium]|nr:NYN domain-containing protein [Spirochaetia bacterium]
MRRKNNAIYIDLENIPGSLDLKLLFEELTLKHNDTPEEENVFVIKMACGNSKSIKKLEKQLAQYNFTIRDTPSITTNYKNRADLIISLEALETIIVNIPVIDRYVFITSDSDFTVIMEALRKYGKEVYLVTKEMVSDKPIFNNCCDEILIIESFMPKPKVEETTIPKTKQEAKQEPNHTKKIDRSVEELIKRVIDSFDPDTWQLVSYVGVKFHQMDKSRMIERSSYKSLGNLLAKLEKDRYTQRKLNEKGHPEIRKISN